MEPTALTDAAFDELADTLLDVAPVGFILLRPVYGAGGEGTVDMAYEFLNPAAQRLLLLPARPTESFLTLHPAEKAVFAFYCAAFGGAERAGYAGIMALAGTSFSFHLVARRQGGRLVVSIAGTADQPQVAGAETPHESQLSEQAARRLAQRQLQDANQFFEQAPVAIALLRGPQHVVELINEANATLLGSTREKLLGQPILEALPVLQGQGFDLVLQRVLAGETMVLKDVPVTLERAHRGQPNLGYYHVTYQPWRAADAAIMGIIAVAVEVTAQVLTRQQLERFNQELEAHALERTHQAQVAHAGAERQRTRLIQLIMDAPAAICVLAGPDFVYELANPRYQALFGGRIQVGRPLLHSVPEFAGHPVWHGLQEVYRTGRTNHKEEALVPVARPGDGVVEERYFDYTEQARYDELGQIDGVLVFAYEVTEQVLARQQVQRLNHALTAANAELCAANKQLTRTNIDLDNFIYTASHDLRAPITNIEGLLQMLEKNLASARRSDELVATVLSHMHRSVARFKRTIGHLTDVTKLQAEFAQPAATVQLAAVVEDVRQDLLPRLTEAGARLEVAVANCQPRLFSEKTCAALSTTCSATPSNTAIPTARPTFGWPARPRATNW